MMLDGASEPQQRNTDEYNAAGEDSSNYWQICDNGGRPCIDPNANQQETNHLYTNYAKQKKLQLQHRY